MQKKIADREETAKKKEIAECTSAVCATDAPT